MATAWIDTLAQRLGRFIGALDRWDAEEQQLLTDVENINSEFTDADRPWLAELQAAAHPERGANVQRVRAIKQVYIDTARTVLVESVLANVPDELPDPSPLAAAEVLIREMIAASPDDTFESNTVNVARASTFGDQAEVVTHDETRFGALLANVYPEVLRGELLTSKQASGVRDTEVYRVRGERKLSPVHRDWPGGSGADVQVQAVHGSAIPGPNPGRSLVNNGGFDIWGGSTSQGTYWTAEVGTWSTDLEQNTTANRILHGSSSLKVTGDGATKHHVHQTLGDPNGAQYRLQPNVVYSLGLWVYAEGTLSGTIEVRLETSEGAIDDAAANEISASVPVSTAADAWTFVNVQFSAPEYPGEGADVRVAVEFTTALGSSEVVYIDDVVLTPLYRSSVSGLWVGLHAGTGQLEESETFTVTITENNVGALVRGFDRLFDLHRLGDDQVPTEGSPEIPDTYVL